MQILHVRYIAARWLTEAHKWQLELVEGSVSASETTEEREACLHHGGELVQGGAVSCIGDWRIARDTHLSMSWVTQTKPLSHWLTDLPPDTLSYIQSVTLGVG